MSGRRLELLSVQALRAVAAFMVVAYHATNQWAEHVIGRGGSELWPNGSAGVDIFFVISGLVMTISVRGIEGHPRAGWIFLRQRLRRILPLYWIATTAKIAMVLAVPALAMRTQLSLPYVLGSYALFPVRDVYGEFVPVLPVGWTLSYEMMFYLLIGCALFLRRPMIMISFPVLLLFAAYALIDSSGFANTIVLEFLFGLTLGMCLPQATRIPVAAGLALFLAGVGVILLVPLASAELRPLIWGVPALAIVTGAVAMEQVAGGLLPRWLLEAGDASYATYLTHGFVVPAVYLVVARLPLSAPLALAATIVGGLLVSGLVGRTVYRAVERPILQLLRGGPRLTINKAAT
ncbi:MAG: acyltransferase family protein [Acetobacteraceae bacterium]